MQPENVIWPSFHAYMQEALYAPGKGYYQRPHRQGREGDYLTAPTLTPLFARCLARSVSKLLQEHPHWQLAEYGPGEGTLARELVHTLNDEYGLRLTTYLIENNCEKIPYLRKSLNSNWPLAHKFLHIQNTLPANFKGIIIANEVMDALPVHLLRTNTQKEFQTLTVKRHNNSYYWHSLPASTELIQAHTMRNIPLHTNYRYELSMELPKWIDTLSKKCQEVLFIGIDYGYPRSEYYRVERCEGSLMCFYKHQQHPNPLVHFSEQDISIHVDFTLLAESLHQAGFTPKALIPQGLFLLQSGLQDYFDQARAKLSYSSEKELTQRIHTLIHPMEMGHNVQVMLACKGMDWKNSFMGCQLHRL